MEQSTTAGPTESDEAIALRVSCGETALFEILVRRNNTRVYRTIRSMLRDEAETEDAMQATYVTAYTKLGTFRGEARFSTWLTRIAVNEALGRLRAKRRHPSVELDPQEEHTVSSPFVRATPTPEAHAGRRELAAVLEGAIDELPELYRVVFVLREIEGMDTADTASALSVTEEVIKTRLSRAKAALRRAIEDQLGEAAVDVYGFHATRCDRVAANVMQRITGAAPNCRPR